MLFCHLKFHQDLDLSKHIEHWNIVGRSEICTQPEKWKDMEVFLELRTSQITVSGLSHQLTKILRMNPIQLREVEWYEMRLWIYGLSRQHCMIFAFFSFIGQFGAYY